MVMPMSPASSDSTPVAALVRSSVTESRMESAMPTSATGSACVTSRIRFSAEPAPPRTRRRIASPAIGHPRSLGALRVATIHNGGSTRAGRR